MVVYTPTLVAKDLYMKLNKIIKINKNFIERKLFNQNIKLMVHIKTPVRKFKVHSFCDCAN